MFCMCCYCKKDIGTETPFFNVDSRIFPGGKEEIFRSGHWAFHIKCWHEIMNKVNFHPDVKVPTFEDYHQ